jgi:hypothetical protein
MGDGEKAILWELRLLAPDQRVVNGLAFVFSEERRNFQIEAFAEQQPQPVFANPPVIGEGGMPKEVVRSRNE